MEPPSDLLTVVCISTIQNLLPLEQNLLYLDILILILRMILQTHMALLLLALLLVG